MNGHTNTKKKGFPKVLIGFLIFLGCALFMILYISIKYVPVHKDNSLMQEHSYMDKNYNEFLADQQKFKENYSVSFAFNKFSEEKIENLRASVYKEYFDHAFVIGQNSFKFKMLDSENNTIKADNSEVLITRYETNKFDKKIETVNFKDGYYVVDNFAIDKPGRWKVIVKVEKDGKSGFFEQGIFAK